MMEDRGVEECFESSGSLQPVSDNDTTILFRDLEHELEIMIQRYHVPPEDLEQLFQVVQSMFELMDSNRDSYDRLEAEKNELEDLWKQEKDKLRSAQRRKLELECRLEEERMKIESEKTTLEKEKVSLQTKLKQVGEHKESVEQELQRIKERTNREEKIRKDLLEQYKKQADIMKTHSLRRKISPKMSAARRRLLPSTPDRKQQNLSMSLRVPPTTGALEESGQSESSLVESGEIPHIAFPDDDSPSTSRRGYRLNQGTLTKRSNLSLEEEFAQHDQDKGSNSPTPANQNGDILEQSTECEEDEEGAWFGYQDTEGTSLAEEMMDPLLSAPMRAEVEMLQKEKEMWQEEREKLEQAARNVRTEKENMEGHNAQILVELRQLKENCQILQEELKDVRSERDEILGHYLEQPFDEYCITRKELNELLKKHQKTAIELEQEKEEREKLQRLLASKKTFLDRFKDRWKRMFSKQNTSEDPVSYKDVMEMEKTNPLSPIPTPLVRSLVPVLSDETLKVEKGWLMSYDSQVIPDKLPQWVGQIVLQGMETDKIEHVAVGRVYHSPLEMFPGHMTPPRLRVGGRKNAHSAMKLLAGLQQLHAEVWVATTEGSMAYIEIIDVVSKPYKVRQRFVVRPKTKQILCMKSIPGVVEESKDFIDSSNLSCETSWVETSFLGHRRSDVTNYFTQSMEVGGLAEGRGRLRPSSAPQRRKRFSADFMASTPDLSSYSEPGPLELFDSNRLDPRAAAADPRPRSDGNVLSESFNSLTTINEIDHSPRRQPRRDDQTPPTSTSEATSHGTLERSDDDQTEASFLVGGHDEVDSDSCHGDQEDPLSSSSLSSSNDSTDERSVQSSRFKEVTSTPVSGYRPKKPLPVSPLHTSSSKSNTSHVTYQDSIPERPLAKSGSNIPNIRVDLPDGRSRTDQRKSGGDTGQDGKDPVMWIVTDNNTLYFYPTTHPSHKPFNSVRLHARAVCIEYIRGKVFVGHVDSSLSVYYIDEFSHTWDVENPERITLPSPNINEVYDVQCIAAVRDRIWVGAGPSIYFLDAELPASREGSIFLDSWRRRPKQILPLGDVVVVTSNTPCLYIFNAQSAQLIQKINIYSTAKLFDLPAVCDPNMTNQSTSPNTMPTITRIVSDETTIYIGTSSGKVVAVPIASLCNLKQSVIVPTETPPPPENTLSPTPNPTHQDSAEAVDETDSWLNKRNAKKGNKKKKKKQVEEEVVKEVKKNADDEWEELRLAEDEDTDGPYLEDTSISLHSLNDSDVFSLVHLRLPDNQISKLKAPSEPVPYHSMPNLSCPFGGRVPISPPIVSYKSLILCAGRGHMEYITEPDPEAIEESISGALRERNESFQLLIWGHKNMLP